MLEKDIQYSILQYLRLKGYFAYKNNTVGIYKKSTGSYIPSQSAGCPDITCIIKGKYIGIECKAPKGKQSDLQKEFQNNIESAGGKYIVAYGIDELVKFGL